MPSKGSPQVAVRLPQEVIDAIDACVESRNNAQGWDREWKRADWLVEAIVEKLNKTGYGRKLKLGIKAVKVDDNMPRELEGDIDALM
jgi:hypothetical protein